MTVEQHLKQAVLWEQAQGKKVQCFLCAHRCLIPESKTGICAVRRNIAGVLYSLNYNKVVSANPDPIEKKTVVSFPAGK